MVLPLLAVLSVFITRIYISGAYNIVQPLEDVNVTVGSQATFLCSVGQVSTQDRFLWFIRVERLNEFCTISASPTRNIMQLPVECDDTIFGRFIGVSLIATIDILEHQYWLSIGNVSVNDNAFDFAFVIDEGNYRIVADWVDLAVLYPLPIPSITPSVIDMLKVGTKLVSSTEELGENNDNIVISSTEKTKENDDNSSSVIGISIGVTHVLLTITVLTIIIIYKTQCYQHFANKQSGTVNNTIPATTRDPNPDGAVDIEPHFDGFSSNTTTYNAYHLEETPTNALSNKQGPSQDEVPAYALPNKMAPDSKSTKPEDNHEVPIYALPNKTETNKCDVSPSDEEMPRYALPNKTKSMVPEADALKDQPVVQDGMYNDGNEMTYDENESDMEDPDLAYSVVNLKKRNQARNVEGLNYADLDLPSLPDSKLSNNDCEDAPVTYSEIRL